MGETFARGVAYAHDWSMRGRQGYGTAADRATLTQVRTSGANWISVMPYAVLPHAQATTFVGGWAMPGGERDALLERTIRDAHQRGLRVMLKPHVWVPRSWPGELGRTGPIAVQQAIAWRAVVEHYADLAARTHCEAFAMGTEMDGIAANAQSEFRAMIAAVRARYTGTLTYCANWNSYHRVAFWDALDVMSIQDYAPRAQGAVTAEALDALEAQTSRVLSEYARAASAASKPLWLTEVGFRCDSDALAHPWRWPQREDRCADCGVQSRALEATLRVAARTPGIRGVFLWKWFSSGGSEDEGACGFALNAPETQQTIAQWFGGRVTPTPPTPATLSPPSLARDF